MAQLEFQLHDEPEMGNYQIKMRRNDKDISETFEVKEYGEYIRHDTGNHGDSMLFSCY